MKGFTLLELLIAICILGILTAAAIPTYMAYKRRAVDDHMIRDVKNAAIAMESYFAEQKLYPTLVSSLIPRGYRQSPGVTLTITLPSQTSYLITAGKPNGTQASFTYDSRTGIVQ